MDLGCVSLDGGSKLKVRLLTWRSKEEYSGCIYKDVLAKAYSHDPNTVMTENDASFNSIGFWRGHVI